MAQPLDRMQRALEILLVEDDDLDARVLRRALQDLAVPGRVHREVDGEKALAYLEAAAAHPRPRLPALILLDLNLPRMNGLEFLRAVKADPLLRLLPVVVLTTSRDGQERRACFALGAAGYFVKPAGYGEFLELMRTLNAYWTLSELPEP